MKIFIAHSFGLKVLVSKCVSEYEVMEHEVYFPFRDTSQGDVEEVKRANLEGIKWCDEVHVFWDGSSYGTIFDLGSAYALGKPIKVVYLAKRTWFTHLKDFEGRYLGSEE